MNYNKWLKLNAHDLSNKTAVITGSTGGLGKEIAKTLTNLNCNLIFLNRSLDKSINLKNELLSMNKNISIEIYELDLSNFEQVKIITEKLKEKQIDFLIHNAGIYNVPVYKTSTGYNNIFQTNFISPYYMTKELINKFSNLKIIAVGSIAHNYSKLNLDDLDFSTSKKHSKIYGNSKRFLMFSLYELFKGKTNLSITNPGITLTNITNHYPKAINWLVKIGIKILFPSPKYSSLNIVKGLFTNTNYHEWITPKTFNIWNNPKIKKLKTCSTLESEEIFKIAEKIYLD